MSRCTLDLSSNHYTCAFDTNFGKGGGGQTKKKASVPSMKSYPEPYPRLRRLNKICSTVQFKTYRDKTIKDRPFSGKWENERSTYELWIL